MRLKHESSIFFLLPPTAANMGSMCKGFLSPQSRYNAACLEDENENSVRGKFRNSIVYFVKDDELGEFHGAPQHFLQPSWKGNLTRCLLGTHKEKKDQRVFQD